MKNNKELAKERMDYIHSSAMGKNWAFDNEVNMLYQQLLDEELSARVLWPTSMRGEATALSEEDISLLAYFMSCEGVKTIVVPQNTGAHWFPIVLTKDPRGAWVAHQVHTSMDGNCGRDTVRQSKKIAQEGLKSYAQANPAKLAPVNAQDRQQIQPVLKMMNAHFAPKLNGLKKEDDEIQDVALRKTLSLSRISTSGIERELTELGEAEFKHQPAKAAQATRNLENLLGKLKGAELKYAVDRLKSIQGGLKPSIAKLIQKVQPQPKYSQNGCAFMPTPKPTLIPRPMPGAVYTPPAIKAFLAVN